MTIKVSVDSKLCAGHAQCNANGPSVYELDDDGYCEIPNPEVGEELRSEARDGASACPERAISIEG